MKKHTLTRLRFLKECASSKAPHQDSASDADNTFTSDGLPNDPPSNANTDGIKENDLHAPGTAKGNEADSESTVSSAVNPPDADIMTGKVAQPKNQNPSSGMATLPTTISTPSLQGSNFAPIILIGGVPRKYEAKAIMTGVGKECKVLAGSTIRQPKTDSSLSYGAIKLRTGVRGCDIVDYTFVRDCIFDSPTAAAEAVCGYRVWYSLFWKEQK